MNYSAGMVSQVFAFVETKQTAELMAAGMSKDEVQDKVIGENLYQLRNETRLRRTFNYVYNRLSSLPDGAVELLVAEMKIYDEAIAHVANQRIEIDLDDGVKVNYEKFQGVEVAQEGKKALKVDLLAKI